MPITERVAYDAVTILEDGQIQLRRARVILDTDGSEISRQFHRQVLEPGDSVLSFPPLVRNVCAVVWTAQVIADYATAKAARTRP